MDNSLARDLEKLTLLVDRHYEEVRASEPCSTREVKQVIIQMIKKTRKVDENSQEAKEWGEAKLTFETCQNLYDSQREVEIVESVKKQLEDSNIELRGLQQAEVQYQTLLMKCLIRNRKGQIDFGFEEDAYALFVQERDKKALEIRDGQRLRLSDFQVCEELMEKLLKPASSAQADTQAEQKKVEDMKRILLLQQNMAKEMNDKLKKENEKLVQQSSKLKKENEQLKQRDNSVWKKEYVRVQELLSKNTVHTIDLKSQMVEKQEEISDYKTQIAKLKAEGSNKKEVNKLRLEMKDLNRVIGGWKEEVQRLQEQVRVKDETIKKYGMEGGFKDLKTALAEVSERFQIHPFCEVEKDEEQEKDEQEQETPPKTQTFKRKSCPSMSGGAVSEKKQKANNSDSKPGLKLILNYSWFFV
eukprot:SAG11_NODE_3121_length_2670_cov_190.799378_2_plen_414_part_00